MLTRHVALVSDDAGIPIREITVCAAALQKQVTRDFAPLWRVTATVSAFASVDDVPSDYWPIIVKKELDEPGAGGYHEDDQGQPYSLVLHDSQWTLSASHEALEMLADPFGRRMVAGTTPDGKRVRYLVEVCDPSEAYSYKVNGVVVSDFITPHYFDPMPSHAPRYSYLGGINKPHQILEGGYLSWVDVHNDWWQATWFDGPAPRIDNLGAMEIHNGNCRSAIDRRTRARKAAITS